MPTRAFWVDLSRQVRMWRTEGEGIVLLGYANMNLRSDAARAHIASMGLRDAIEPFIAEDLSFSIDDRGSKVINGAWVSGDIRVRSGGHLLFGKGLPMDHRCAWLDIDDANMLGNNPEPVRKSKARRLQCRNTQVRKRFEDVYILHLQNNNMPERSQEGERAAKEKRWTLSQEVEWEIFDDLRLEGVDQAASKCRKLCVGNVDWSPTSTQLRVTVVFLRLC
jgi:hypothetical protein